MIKINQIKLPYSQDIKEDLIKKKISKIIATDISNVLQIKILKKSIDARKKPELFLVYQAAIQLNSASLEAKILNRAKKQKDNNISYYEENNYDFTKGFNEERLAIKSRPVIVGAGPAGLFCGYYLAKYGYAPIIIERGKSVEERSRDVEQFFETGILDTSSNVQFGEGGAGTFSDGKLNTVVKDATGRNKEVLRLFVENGAKEDILYDPKPHVGTDILHTVIKNIRNAIIQFGGEVSFSEQLLSIHYDDGHITSITTNKRQISTENVVLAIGHSARDTFRMLNNDTEVSMHAKSFAVGFRIEHPQSMINTSQYGTGNESLPAAPYKLTYQSTYGRGVYSFCMCPGGYVVNASSQEGMTAVNGMSYSQRDGANANSAIIVAVSPEDYEDDSPLGGIIFQEQLEKAAFEVGQGKIPQQLFKDFIDDKISTQYGEYKSSTKGATIFANIRHILPEECNLAFIEAMHDYGRKIKNYNRDDAIISAVESRTSSPVRIERDENFESNIRGLYPCGEGAGYAGGIMSAAMDGMKIAEAIANKYLPYN